MWTQVHKLFQPSANDNAAVAMPPVVPLRKPSLPLDSIHAGHGIRFSAQCPLPPLSDAQAVVIAIRQYRFGSEMLKSYQLQIGAATHYFLTIAEDEQGHYLSLSRRLDETEQDRWFGRDALGFFTEPSTARSIRCKADLMVEGDWAAARYSKTVEWVEGSVTKAGSSRGVRSFHYNLLVNESGEKALEIEHDDSSGENRVFVTVYRPLSDMVEIIANAPKMAAAPIIAPTPVEKPLPILELAAAPAQPKQRPDFRRLAEDTKNEIHIARTAAIAMPGEEMEPQLPSFLLSREGNYLSLDAVIPPEAERVRVGITTAQQLIEQAVQKKVRVRDILREALGLESALSDEVIFELPLTDADYRTLAMRYKLRPDHRIEIRARLEEELRNRLLP